MRLKKIIDHKKIPDIDIDKGKYDEEEKDYSKDEGIYRRFRDRKKREIIDLFLLCFVNGAHDIFDGTKMGINIADNTELGAQAYGNTFYDYFEIRKAILDKLDGEIPANLTEIEDLREMANGEFERTVEIYRNRLPPKVFKELRNKDDVEAMFKDYDFEIYDSQQRERKYPLTVSSQLYSMVDKEQGPISEYILITYPITDSVRRTFDLYLKKCMVALLLKDCFESVIGSLKQYRKFESRIEVLNQVDAIEDYFTRNISPETGLTVKQHAYIIYHFYCFRDEYGNIEDISAGADPIKNIETKIRSKYPELV